MKRLFAFVAALLFIACNSDDVYTPTNKAMRFHAIIEDASTRTFVDENIRLRWTAEDLITLFEGTTRNKKYKFLGETGDNAGDFEDITTGFGSGNDVNRYYALYPYASTTKLHEDGYITYTLPTEQTYAENSFGLGTNPMVAVTEDKNDYDLSFKNVCGYLRLYLYGEDVTIKSITIEGNNSEPIAGKAIITPTYGGNPTIEMDATATTTVTLNCGEGVAIGSTVETSTPFWIVLPPTTFANGFTLTITDTNDNEFTKSISSNVNIQRNKYLSARIEVEFPKPAVNPVPNNQIWYTTTSGTVANICDEDYDELSGKWYSLFGANIISNTYSDGMGIVVFDNDVIKIEGNPNFSDVVKSIYLPDSVKEIGSNVFYSGYSKLSEISLGNGVISIGDYAFGCCRFSEITLPKSLINIGDGAFYCCQNLTRITIPNSVETIGDAVFHGCASLKEIEGKFVTDDGKSLICNNALLFVVHDEELSQYTIPTGVTTIGERVFNSSYFPNLQSVTIPNSVTQIGEYAFYESKASFSLPKQITRIGADAFLGCVNLESAELKDISYLGEGAFYGCKKLENVIIGDGVRCILPSTFESCTALTNVSIGNGVELISGQAFTNCTSLQSITIPKNVRTVGDSEHGCVFEGCSALRSVWCEATTPPDINAYIVYDYDTLGLSTKTTTIYVPNSSLDAYRAAEYWKDYTIYGY